MTTERQRNANRRNAGKSTGPRTSAGKALVRFNPIRHGMRANNVVIPGIDSPAEWEEFRAGVVASLAPVGPLEQTFADHAAGLLWRLRRVERFESHSVAAGQAELEVPARPRHDFEPSITQRDMTDAEFLANRESRIESAKDALTAWQSVKDLAGRLLDLPADAIINADAGSELLRACAREVEEKRLDCDEFPGSLDFLALLAFAGLPPPWDVPWTAEMLRKGVRSISGALKEKPTPAAFLKEIAEVADMGMDDAQAIVGKCTAAAATLKNRIALNAAIECAGRLIPDGETGDRIARYESHIQRQLTKTLDELERIQSRRQGTAAAGS